MELQLLLRACDGGALLATARVCHALCHAAAHIFAWSAPLRIQCADVLVLASLGAPAPTPAASAAHVHAEPRMHARSSSREQLTSFVTVHAHALASTVCAESSVVPQAPPLSSAVPQAPPLSSVVWPDADAPPPLSMCADVAARVARSRILQHAPLAIAVQLSTAALPESTGWDEPPDIITWRRAEHNAWRAAAAAALAAISALPLLVELSVEVEGPCALRLVADALAAGACAARLRALRYKGEEDLHVFSHNAAGADDTSSALAAMLPRLPALRELSVQWEALGAQGMRSVAVAGAASHITTLTLSHCLIHCDGAVALAEWVRSSVTLTALAAEHNNIYKVGCTALADAASASASLRSLSLLGNNPQDRGSAALGATLQRCVTLTRATAGGVAQLDVGAIAAGLSHARALRELVLEDFTLEKSTAALLAAGVARCASPLRIVRLRWRLQQHGMDDDDVEVLVGALHAHGASLSELALGEHIEHHRALALAIVRGLPHWPRLSTLHLWSFYGSVPDAVTAAASLLDALAARAPALRTLCFTKSRLPMPELAAALPRIRQLTQLAAATSCYISDDDGAVLAGALPHCTSLAHLDVRFDRFGPKTARALAAALVPVAPGASRLRGLCVLGNGIGVDGSAALLAARSTLHELDLRHVHVDAGGVSALATSLARAGAALRSLRISAIYVEPEAARALCRLLAGAAPAAGITRLRVLHVLLPPTRQGRAEACEARRFLAELQRAAHTHAWRVCILRDQRV